MGQPRKIWYPAPGSKPVPSCKPQAPAPTSDIPPDDLLCTWVFRVTSTKGNGKGYWELKYIHSGCSQHTTLPRAA